MIPTFMHPLYREDCCTGSGLASPHRRWGRLPLTIERAFPYSRLSREKHTKKAYGEIDRSAPGHARPPHPEDTGARADARVGPRAAHPADVRRRAAGAARLALPGAASPRAPGLDWCKMGRHRRRTAGEVLLADAGGPEAAGQGGRAV